MSLFKMKRSFGIEETEELMKSIDQIIKGSGFKQQLERLKEKAGVWGGYVEKEVCPVLVALADEINRDHKRVNVVTVGGAGVGLAATPCAVVAAGGALTGGFLAAPLTAGLSIPIGGLIAAVCGGVAALGAGTAGGAMITDQVLRYKNKKKALEVLENESKLATHLNECIKEMKQTSKKVTMELINLAKILLGPDYIKSRDSVKEPQESLHCLIEWFENHITEIAEFGKTAVSKVSTLQKILDVLETVSLATKVAAGLAVVFVVSIPVSLFAGIYALYDLVKGSKTQLAANLKEHVSFLKSRRDRVDEALQRLTGPKRQGRDIRKRNR